MPDGKAYHNIENYPDAITYPGIVVIRFDGPLFFATASSLLMRIRELTRDVEPPVKAVILDMESTNIIDLEGSDELREIAKELDELDVAFYLARVKVKIKHILVQDGVFEIIAEERFHSSVESAVEAALQATGQK
jgi:MFS superfamily sulfate permease-like transporter